MYFVNDTPLDDYFAEEQQLLSIPDFYNDKQKQYYEFIPFHPVSATSEMVGTSIEELLQHNYPNKNSWENARFCNYPEEVIIRMNHRSEVKFILIRSKFDRPIPEVEIYLGDGVFGNFNDTKYTKLRTERGINEDGRTIRVEGIGNFLKFRFTRGNIKSQRNPFGQVSLSQLKIFGRKVNHLLFYNEGVKADNDPEVKNNKVDKVLIEMGLPITDEYNLVQDQNYEIAPVDEDTKLTIRDLLEIARRAEHNKDYEILSKIKKDIRQAFFLGNEILNIDRQIYFAQNKEDYDKCIQLKKKRQQLEIKRDHIDIIYETKRYEQMILLQGGTPEDLLQDTINKELLEQQRIEKERREKERRLKEMRDELERQRLEQYNKDQRNKYIDSTSSGQNNQKPQKTTTSIKKSSYTTSGNNGGTVKRGKNEIFYNSVARKGGFGEDELSGKKDPLDELVYNQGDKDLEKFFNPRVRGLGNTLETPDINKLRRALRMGILTVTGVRLYSAMISEDWKMREAAVRAFLDYVENPLLPRYLKKTFPLFMTCIEICKLTCDDKVIQIYLEGLKLLQTCLAPPICGNDVDPNFIQKSINYFLPIYIKKISEFNDKQRDLTLKTIIDIFRHPALNVGELVKACLDIVEHNDGVTPDKQPWNVLLARLEIILRVLDEYGIDEKLWDWYNVFVELIIPSLFHQKPDCRLVAEEICVILYKMVGSDIRNIINDLNNLKPNLKEKLNTRFNEADIIVKVDNDTSKIIKSIGEENKDTIPITGPKINELEPIIESRAEDTKSKN